MRLFWGTAQLINEFVNYYKCSYILSKNLKYHNKKRQDDYGQNYYKIYYLAVVFNIASNEYWKDS